MTSPFGMGGGTAGARCAVHPEQPAQGICARCGNFMCTGCTEVGTYETCPTCRALTGELPGFVWSRDNFTLDGLMGFAWEHFKREWVMLSLAALVFMVVMVGVSFAGSLLQAIGAVAGEAGSISMSVVSSVLQSIVQSVLTGGFVLMVYAVMKGQTADVGKLFGQFGNFGAYASSIGIYFAVLLVPMAVVGGIVAIIWNAGGETAGLISLGVAFLLVIVPLIWVLLPFTLVPMEIALGGETSGVQAVKNAFGLAEGKRWWMILFAIVGFFIAMGGVLLCCIGVLPALALIQMFNTCLYLALRNGSRLEPMRGVHQV